MVQPDSTRARPAYAVVTGGVVRGPEGASIAVGPAAVTIGRSPQASLTLGDPHVSALHCELQATARGVVLRDLDSTNGTRVGGVRVAEVWLEEPARIRLGDTELSFVPAEKAELLSSSTETGFGAMVGSAPAMRRVYELLKAVAPTELSVLISAETGSGKELVARALHDASPRRRGPFVVVDCGALPTSLAESILFGHERGAFTGATERKAGAFLEANGGTIFLDELGELPEEVQPKLLRAAAERAVKRLGGSRYEPVDVRIVAATRRDLRREMNAQRFREDLYFRLAQVRIELPPLRERPEDIPLLTGVACERVGNAAATERVLRLIQARFTRYDWPGNVRELMNVASVLAAIGDAGATGLVEHVLPLEGGTAEPPSGEQDAAGFVQAKRRFEEQYFRRLLHSTDGNISEIARRCGLARHQVRAHLSKLGLT
ncbi:MAG TPA: sigma 54-interacting transcriptional regulator [Polyangiaceae bacterium]|nr:sigma 54-interacting transcriptional regulator [Polyangiaceae bacterium]